MQELTRQHIDLHLAEYRLSQSQPPAHRRNHRAACCLECRARIALHLGRGLAAADLRASAIICRSRALGLPDPC